MSKAFVLQHYYSDGGAKPVVIYVGSDKADAFEALWKFLMEDASQGGCGLLRHSAPTSFMTNQTEGE